MGRSRAVSQAAVDNHNQIRGKRKRTASGAEVEENSGTAQKAVAQEISEPKGAFYHCNYCNKDISGKIRIKCVVCPDFDLCIECFSVGAELAPHKCNHPYRVMDNLAFPLICPDWNVDEEMLLLECVRKDADRAFELCKSMIRSGYHPDEQTLKLLISSFCNNRDFDGAIQVLKEMFERCIALDSGILSDLCLGLHGCGREELVKSLCGEMEARRLIPQGCGMVKVIYSGVEGLD